MDLKNSVIIVMRIKIRVAILIAIITLIMINCNSMQPNLGNETAATYRFAATSEEIKNAVVVKGEIHQLEEKGIYESGSASPSLYSRQYKLVNPQVIWGNSSFLQGESTIIFTGYSLLSPNQRQLDIRLPVLSLEGQDFFDSPIVANMVQGIAIIGGPELRSIAGFRGRKASIETGKLLGLTIRPFLLSDSNKGLDESIPLLLGWQDSITQKSIEYAKNAPHPIVAIDAMRIAVKHKDVDQLKNLSKWLIHPVMPANVKKTAIELIGEAMMLLPADSKEIEELIEILVKAWESEKFYSTDNAYMNAIKKNLPRIKLSQKSGAIKMLLHDIEAMQLRKQLESELNK
jgi:hypothetical protein